MSQTNVKTLILPDYHNRVLSYCTSEEGMSLLNTELCNLIGESNDLYDMRETLQSGIKLHRKDVQVKIVDECGVDSSGELLRYRSHFTIYPAPDSQMIWSTTGGNIIYIAKQLRRNCFYIKKVLNTMRNVVDHAQEHNITIQDALYNMYVDSERLYASIQEGIGFLANTVTPGIPL
jgi:hypothetical protein